MTLRRLSTPRTDDQVVLSEVVGTAYPNPLTTDLDEEGALRLLRNPAIAVVMRNVAGVLNKGPLYDDATQAAVLVAVEPLPPPGTYPWPEGYSLNSDPLPHGVPSNLNVTWKPGVVEWYQTTRPGRASCSVHGGGNMAWCGVSDQRGVLRPEPLTMRGQGGTPHIETLTAWFVMMWCVTDQQRAGYYNYQDPA